jgi:hypothetical protein
MLLRLWLLGSYQAQVADRAQKVSDLHLVTVATRMAEAAAEVTSSWPESYFAFLEEVAGRYGDASSGRLMRRFGSFYKALYSRKLGRAGEDLRRGFEAYVKERWPGQIAERNQRLSAETRGSHLWVPVTRAAKMLHWKPSRLRSMIASGAARGHLEVRPSGRVAGVVHREDLCRLREDSATWVDLKTACKVLRVGKKRVHSLVKAGLLEPLSGPGIDGFAVWQFRRQDIEGLREARVPPPSARDLASGSRSVQA